MAASQPIAMHQTRSESGKQRKHPNGQRQSISSQDVGVLPQVQVIMDGRPSPIALPPTTP